MNDKKASHIQITIAIIGLVGTLGAALITSLVVYNKESPSGETDSPVVQTQEYGLRAEIDDPDGFTNVRSLPSINGQIIDTVRKGEIFYTHYQKSNWWHIKTPSNKVGYIHSSRIKLLE